MGDNERKARGIESIAKRGASTFKIDVREIIWETGFNTRKIDLSDRDQRVAMDALKWSLIAFGMLQPIVTRFDPGRKGAIGIDGHRRGIAWREAFEEGLVPSPLVPIVTVDGKDERRRKALNIAANTYVPLTDLELGEGFQVLVDYGMSVEQIADSLKSYNATKIRACLALADSPMAVKEMVASGAVRPAAARQAVQQHGDAAPAVLEQRIEEAKAAGKTTVTRPKRAAASTSTAPPERDEIAEKQGEALAELAAYLYKVGAFNTDADELVLAPASIPARYVRNAMIALYGKDDHRVKNLIPSDPTAMGDAA